jgi:hypothetical protein
MILAYQNRDIAYVNRVPIGFQRALIPDPESLTFVALCQLWKIRLLQMDNSIFQRQDRDIGCPHFSELEGRWRPARPGRRDA